MIVGTMLVGEAVAVRVLVEEGEGVEDGPPDVAEGTVGVDVANRGGVMDGPPEVAEATVGVREGVAEAAPPAKPVADPDVVAVAPVSGPGLVALRVAAAVPVAAAAVLTSPTDIGRLRAATICVDRASIVAAAAVSREAESSSAPAAAGVCTEPL